MAPETDPGKRRIPLSEIDPQSPASVQSIAYLMDNEWEYPPPKRAGRTVITIRVTHMTGAEPSL